MEEAAVLFLVGLLVIAHLIMTNALLARQIKRIEHATRVERTRSTWAESRDLLFNLVRAGELDIRSETFRTFYGLQTAIMRRPEAYDAFSKQLARGLIAGPRPGQPSWQNEVQAWPPGMRAVIETMNNGLRSLAFDYSGGRRILWFFFTRVVPWLAMHKSRRIVRRVLDLSQPIRFVTTMRTYYAVLQRLRTIGDAAGTAYVGPKDYSLQPTP